MVFWRTFKILIFLTIFYPAKKLLYIPELPEYLNGTVLAWLIAAVCLAGSAAGIAVFFHRTFEMIPGVKPLLDFLDKSTGGMVNRVLGATDVYGGNWQTLVKMVLQLFYPFLSSRFVLMGKQKGCFFFLFR